MPAMGKVHCKDAISWLQYAEVNSHIRLAAAVRLHIDMFSAKQLPGPVDRQLLCNVYVFAAAIPSAPRIAFRVLVGQDGALRFHDSSAGKIFRSDQFDI